MLSGFLHKKEQQISEARSLRRLADIAMASLCRLPQPVVQVCGPLTTGGKGTLMENMAYFYEAIHFLHYEFNFSVFDQIFFHGKISVLAEQVSGGRRERHREILQNFYTPIFDSGLISLALFLPGWHTSRGAIHERAMANLNDHMYCMDMHSSYVVEIDKRYHIRRLKGDQP